MNSLNSLVMQKIHARAWKTRFGFWPAAARMVDDYRFRRKCSSYLASAAISDQARAIAAELRRHGFHAIPGFLPADKCAELRDRIDAAARKYPACIHPKTAHYDLRIHGIENLDEAFRFYSDNPLLREIASAYLGEPVRTAFTLGARLEPSPGNPGSGGGWHRDSCAPQIKTMVYLSDAIGEVGGAFQLLSRSQELLQSIRDNSTAHQPYNETRWTDEQVDRVLSATGGDRLKTLSGNAGTLLIFDTSTVHRGAPLQMGVRYALTNYLFEERRIAPALYAHYVPVAGFDAAGNPLGYASAYSA